MQDEGGLRGREGAVASDDAQRVEGEAVKDEQLEPHPQHRGWLPQPALGPGAAARLHARARVDEEQPPALRPARAEHRVAPHLARPGGQLDLRAPRQAGGSFGTGQVEQRNGVALQRPSASERRKAALKPASPGSGLRAVEVVRGASKHQPRQGRGAQGPAAAPATPRVRRLFWRRGTRRERVHAELLCILVPYADRAARQQGEPAGRPADDGGEDVPDRREHPEEALVLAHVPDLRHGVGAVGGDGDAVELWVGAPLHVRDGAAVLDHAVEGWLSILAETVDARRAVAGRRRQASAAGGEAREEDLVAVVLQAREHPRGRVGRDVAHLLSPRREAVRPAATSARRGRRAGNVEARGLHGGLVSGCGHLLAGHPQEVDPAPGRQLRLRPRGALAPRPPLPGLAGAVAGPRRVGAQRVLVRPGPVAPHGPAEAGVELRVEHRDPEPHDLSSTRHARAERSLEDVLPHAVDARIFPASPGAAGIPAQVWHAEESEDAQPQLVVQRFE
mmetsp:Transcript_26766/g.76416  ORF Transcript_26766/g.76416 Transcript_26766/m.76416 type:complete len:505 (+) Transcript_26766:509-2023(+)